MSLREKYENAKHFVTLEVWKHDLNKLPLWRALALRVVRIAYLAFRGTLQDKAFLRASTLSYTTLLSLPPVLALAFGIGRSLGVTDELRDTLSHKLGAENENIREVVQQIFDYVDSTPLSVFNGVGFAFLFLALVKLLGTIERSFNDIFGAVKARSLLRKVTDYLSVLIVGPIVVTVATGTMTTLRNQSLVQKFQDLPILGAIVGAPLISGFITMWLGFAFLYLFMPNVRVRLFAGAIGAAVAALGWLTAYEVFLNLQIGLSRANIIYGSFAGLPLMLIWLNVSWGIVLLGGEVVAALQNEIAHKRLVLAGDPTAADRERYAMQIMISVAREFEADRRGLTVEEVVESNEIPHLITMDILARLEAGGLVVGTATDPELYVLSRDPRRLRVVDILETIRGTYDVELEPEVEEEPTAREIRSRDILVRLQETARSSDHNPTLHDLVAGATKKSAEQKLVTLRSQQRLDS